MRYSPSIDSFILLRTAVGNILSLRGEKDVMTTLKNTLKVISMIMVFLLCLDILTPQAVAISTTRLAIPVRDFTCLPAPKIKAPPKLSVSTRPSTQTLRNICPAGLVPQPVSSPSATAPQPSVPFQMNSPRVSYSSSSSNGYHYVTATQYTTSIGATGSYTQEKPHVAPQEGHSLAELAILSPYYDSNGQPVKQQQIIEIGWKVESIEVNKDMNIHLFVFHWINRGIACLTSCGQTCYNACGYVQYSKTAYPGMTVDVTQAPQKYAIMQYQGNWWIWYQDQWIGYFPDSLWSTKGITFNKISVAQWFGEVGHTPASKPHTQMGNGLFGKQPGSASITDMHLIDSSLKESNAAAAPSYMTVTDPNCYNYGNLAGHSFTYGGPGC
jgi:hypothetical protein